MDLFSNCRLSMNPDLNIKRYTNIVNDTEKWERRKFVQCFLRNKHLCRIISISNELPKFGNFNDELFKVYFLIDKRKNAEMFNGLKKVFFEIKIL